MKTMKFFALAAMAAVVTLSGCEKDPKKTDEGEKSSDNLITAFTLKLGADETIEGGINRGAIQLLYRAGQLTAMTTATAEVTTSEGAKIAPNPTEAMDYSKPIEFTVTAEDGTERKYTTAPEEFVPEYRTKVTELIKKDVIKDMGIANPGDAALTVDRTMAISGDNVVIDTKVFDRKTLVKVGNLDMTGITDKIAWLTNDEKGHLIAGVTPDGTPGTAPASIYAWIDGYNAAPTLKLGPSASAIARWLQASGDITSGPALISTSQANATGNNMIFDFYDGVRLTAETNPKGQILTNGAATGIPSADGSWLQIISPASSDPNGQWFIWDAMTPGQSEDHNIGTFSGAGWNLNQDGVSATPLTSGDFTFFKGTVGGVSGWGNLRVAGICAFTFNGRPHCAMVSHGYVDTFHSIMDDTGEIVLDPAVPANQYLCGVDEAGRPGVPSAVTWSRGNNQGLVQAPSVAYIFDEAEQCGYVYMYTPVQRLTVYKLEREEIVEE
jgi:hypothetical protein